MGSLTVLETGTQLSLVGCTSFGKVYDVDQQIIGGAPLSHLDAAACPDSLGISEQEFVNRVNGTYVAWMYSPAPSIRGCENDFFYTFDMHQRVARAGGKGIIWMQNKTPGIWYRDWLNDPGRFDATFHEAKRQNMASMPFVHCQVQGSEFKQHNFFERLHDYSADGNANFPEGIVVSDIELTANKWQQLFMSNEYVVLFRIVLPLVYFVVTGLCLKSLHHRLTQRRPGAKRNNYNSRVTRLVEPASIALLVEAVTCLLFGVMLILDGHWSVPNNPLEGARYLVLGMAMLVAGGSSTLIMLGFGNFRRTVLTSKMFSERTILEKHPNTTVASAISLIVGEFILQRVRTAYSDSASLAVNIFILVVSFAVTVAFTLESVFFAKLLNENLVKKKTGLQSEAVLKARAEAMVRKTVLCTIGVSASTASIMVLLIVSGKSDGVWHPINWTIAGAMGHLSRVSLSFFKARLLTLRNDKKRTARVTSADTVVKNVSLVNTKP